LAFIHTLSCGWYQVRVALVPRQKRFATILDGQWASTCYSHHQKTITVDAEIPQENNNAGKRRIVTFVGGLDVTCGRWDNQQHALFASLKTTHAGDFYQTCFPVDAEHGPRQPWHDIHSKIEGPAAFDVLQNFVERWRRQVKDEEGDPDLVDSHVDDLDFDHPGPASDGEKWQVG
jgi:phospholipase D1/2